MAIKANIVVDQGTDFLTAITVEDQDGNLIDLTGYTGAAQMRKTYSSLSNTAFIVNIDIGAAEVSLSMDANTTGGIAAGRYVYDCELISSANTISRLVEGIVTITPQVTK